MITKTTLGAVTTHVAVGGSAEVVLAKHRTENRMTPLLRYREADGAEHVVEFSRADTVSVMRSLVRMFSATQPEISAWWETLTGQSVSY